MDTGKYPDTHSQASQAQSQGAKVMTRSLNAASDNHKKKKLQIQKLTNQLDAQSQHVLEKARIKGTTTASSSHRSQSQKALLIKQLMQQ